MKQYWKEWKYSLDQNIEKVLEIESCPVGWDHAVCINLAGSGIGSPTEASIPLGVEDLRTLIEILKEAEEHQTKLSKIDKIQAEEELFK